MKLKSELKKQLAEEKQVFDKQLSEAEQLFRLNESITEISDGLFDALAKLANQQKCYEVERRARRLKRVMHDLYRHKTLQIPVQLLFDQGVVLAVSAMENYLKTIFSVLIRNNPELILRHEKSFKVSSKLISDYGFQLDTYIDQVLIETKTDINFQDLQSTFRVFAKYFKISLYKIVSSTLIEKIVLAQACRHIILHRARKIDKKFLRQIRKTRFAKMHKEGSEVEISQDMAQDLIEAVKIFGDSFNKELQ